jgi:hypothetical protein
MNGVTKKLEAQVSLQIDRNKNLILNKTRGSQEPV